MNASWWIKIARAQHHLDDLHAVVAKFREDNAAAGVDMRTEREGDESVGLYSLRMVRPPTEELSGVLGDVVHNARSALDHIVVAFVPGRYRRDVSFPLFERDPSRTGGNGLPVEIESWKRWTVLKTLLPETAITQIEALQPYHDPPEHVLAAFPNVPKDTVRQVNALWRLSAFDNADKHRGPIAYRYGLKNPTTEILRGSTCIERHAEEGFRDDGAVIHSIRFSPDLPESEMEVKISGIPCITVDIADLGGSWELPEVFEGIVTHVEDVLRYLEQFLPV